MSAPAELVAHLDARIADLQQRIDAAQQIIEKATADIQVLEQAKEVLSRDGRSPTPPANSGSGKRRVSLAPLSQQKKSLAFRLPVPTHPVRAFGGAIPPEGTWQRVALELLDDQEPHATMEIYNKVYEQFGNEVKYSAVASWLLRAAQRGELEKDGRGSFRLPLRVQQTADDALVEMGLGLLTADPPEAGASSEEPVASEEQTRDPWDALLDEMNVEPGAAPDGEQNES